MNYPQRQDAVQDVELPEVPGEDIGDEEWFAAWTPELDRLAEMRSGAVQGMSLDELDAYLDAQREARRKRSP